MNESVLFRVSKMIATSGFLTALECTKFVFGRGSAPDPWGAYSAPPDALAGLRGPTSKGEGREGEEDGRDGKGRREEGKGREEGGNGKGRGGEGGYGPP